MKNYYIILLLLVFSTFSFGQKKNDEPTSYKDDFTFSWKKGNDSLLFIAKSKLNVVSEFIISNRKSGLALNSLIVKPKDSVALIKYKGSKPDSIFRKELMDSLKISYYFGHKSVVRPDLDFAYRLPFKEGKKYRVSQGFKGKASHNSTASMYAIDFQLEVGEPVYAARGGLVIKVIDWFTKQGGKELIKAANRIVILHDDGTMASYVHLDYKGSFVKEGDMVAIGDKIGVSGLTGFTRGPHLHFVVRKERDIAIPIQFSGYLNENLKQGRKYQIKQ